MGRVVFGIPDLFSLIIFLAVYLFLAFKLYKYGTFFFNFFLVLGLEHLFATLFYWLYSLSNAADASMYYSAVADNRSAISWFSLFSAGAGFIRFIVYPCVKIFNLSYLGTFLQFGIFGLIAYYYLIIIILKLIKAKYIGKVSKRMFYFLLMPNMHFWTCAIGKDSVIFLFIVILIYGFLFKKRIMLFLGAAIIGIIRPHVFILILVGMTFGYLFLTKKVSISQKIFILLSALIGIYFALPIFMQRLGLTELSVDSINGAIDKNLSYNQGRGSSVDMSDSNIIVKMLSYLFRPLFFDAKNMLSLLASIENLFWIYMVFIVLKNIKKNLKSIHKLNIVSPLIFSFLFVLIGLSSVLNNIGIALREKSMLFPMLILLYFILTIRNVKASRANL